MNFTKLSLRLKGTASSKSSLRGEPDATRGPTSSKRNLHFDLFAHLTFMASVATAGVSRSELFEFASELPYASSRYFREIHILARKMNMDYATACTVVAGRAKNQEVTSLLLRMAGSLSSGEHEVDFLRREAEVIGESYTNRYERDVEALKKWGDAYVTLLVASGMIVIVAVISMMIYQIGIVLIIGLALLMVLATVLGAWILYISAPREIKTLAMGPTSRLQLLGYGLFKYTTPLAAVIGSICLLLGYDLGFALIVSGIIIFPAGYAIERDDKNLSRKDADIASVVRVLGGVTAAVGTTLTEALNTIDRRSMGALMPEITRLRQRLKSGITPDLCWRRLVEETGSELIGRTVQIFYKSISMGGEPGRVASASAFYASKIAYLRDKRNMVSVTFSYLIFPMHIAMVGLLEFIVEIMNLFSASVKESQEALSGNSGITDQFNVTELFTFGQVNLLLVDTLVTTVVLVLTLVNAFAPKAAAGGGNLRISYNLAIMMLLSGALMIGVPWGARSFLGSILNP